MRVKSKKLRASARGEQCTLRLVGICNFNPETVVLAHIGKGGGMGSKCGDNMAVFACSNCHDVIDGRASYDSILNPNIAAEELRALGETQQIWFDNGLMKHE